MVIIDFETRSRCDLPVEGTANYIVDPSTDIICMALYNTETPHKQIWYSGTTFPEQMRYALEHADLVAAHGAEFDQGIYECIGVPDYGFPTLPREVWYCTMAQCRVNNLPAGLDDAAWALGLQQRKGHQGKQLIKDLSIPRADGTFNFDPVKIKEMGEYCIQDVIVTAAVYEATRSMTQNEHLDWLKNCEINERGVKVDLELANLSLQYAGAEQSEIAVKLKKLTNGAVDRHTQAARVKQWIESKLGVLHPVMQMMTVYKNGVAKISLDKNIRRNILLSAESGETRVDPNIIEVIQLIDDGSKSSVAKFKRMLEIADSDDHRVRGAFVFAGASATTRYASRGLQLHNMRRDCWNPDQAEHLIKLMWRNALLIHTSRSDQSVMDTLSKLLRPALIPEKGKVFVVGDWSAIEAGVLPYLSDSAGGDAKLDLIESGADIYIHAAKEMGLGDDARQIGKVSELACGFGGGWRAFRAMARNYGLHMSKEEAEIIVSKWRRANHWAVVFWSQLETAAKAAIGQPNTIHAAGLIKYIYTPDLIDGTLICILPGNHFIQYPKAKIEEIIAPWGDPIFSVTSLKASYKPKADAKAWPRGALYGGLFAENVTQAFAAAILRAKLRSLPDVVADVHDEIILEVPEDIADYTADVLRLEMETVPVWAEGLPLKAEPIIMTRYGKGL